MKQTTVEAARLSQETTLRRLRRFLAKPWTEKAVSLQFHKQRAWHSVVSSISRVPRPVRMPLGFWWVAWDEIVRDEVLGGTFEASERRFVEKFLRPGMTVIDVGAYFGLYTLTASVRVGRRGRVIAFEPSPYQMARLKWNLRLNCCRNVHTERVALGDSEGQSEFFFVGGGASGLSSLRAPDTGIAVPITRIRVQMMTLDSYLRRNPLTSAIDLMKVDVEGGELGFFRGALNVLLGKERPVILCELQDLRTRPWGYRANHAAALLQGLGFRWFSPSLDGRLRSVPEGHQFDGNYVAVPEEGIGQIEVTS